MASSRSSSNRNPVRNRCSKSKADKSLNVKRAPAMKLGTESLGSELHCASEQDADLRDKLYDATCELAAEKKKCSDIVKQLSNHAKENKELSVNLDAAKRCMSEMVVVVDTLSRSMKDMETESKETQEFLTKECSDAMELLQEVKSEKQNLQYMFNDKDDQCRRLLEELEQTNLYVQMLHDQFGLPENRAIDTFLSQGTEITGASLALGKSTILANSLSEEELRKLYKANGIEEDTEHDGIVTSDVVHNNATSSVHSVLQAVKNSDNDNAGKYTDACDDDDINGQNFCDGIRRHATPFEYTCQHPFWHGSFIPLKTFQEEDEDSATAEGSNDVDATEESSDVIRPVGFATPFRSISPLKPIQEEDSATDELSNHGDAIVTQINSVNVMISKFAVISSVVQDELKSQLKQLESDKKHLEKQLQNERSNKTETIIELNKKIKNLEMEISVSRRQENILTSAKNKLTSICDGHDKTIKSLTRELQDTRMRNSCLESENREKRQQLTTALDKISNLVSSSNHGYPGIQYVSLSEVLSEKFNLKGEIARLQGQLSENEKLLDEMASKFSRNKSVLESNWQKAEAEVQRLDDVIDSVLNIFRQIPETIEKCEQLSRLWDTLSGNEDINGLNRDRIGSKLIESDVSSSDA